MAEKVHFEIGEEDLYAVDIARNVANLLKERPELSSEQAAALRRASEVLGRLPATTPGAFYEFAVVLTGGTDESYERRFIQFTITDEEFEISRGGVVYDQAVGSDTLPFECWHVGLGHRVVSDFDLYDIEESVEEYLSLGAKITISDESQKHSR